MRPSVLLRVKVDEATPLVTEPAPVAVTKVHVPTAADIDRASRV